MVDYKGISVPHEYFSFAISTDNEICSRIGSNIIDQNGTAVDSLIAGLFCLSVVHPHSSGIGGGGFAMIYDSKDLKSEFINFREMAPGCSNEKMSNNNHKNINEGGLSVAVPGELKGYEYMWKKYGRLDLKQLIEPSIKLAQNGIVIDEALSIALEKWETKIKTDPLFKSIFTKGNRTLKFGETYKNPKLAQTYRKISQYGFNILYDNFSSTIEREVKANGGCIEQQDLKNYKILAQNPIEMIFGKYKVFLPPPPTSGPILGLILNIFSLMNFSRSEFKLNPAKIYHFMIETFKFAFSIRNILSDPNFNSDSSRQIKKILSIEFAKDILKKIPNNSTKPRKYYGDSSCLSLKTGTTHLVVKDKDGLFASVTSTINGYFGAKFASANYGFIYNNEMDDFCFPNMSNDYMLPPNPNNYPRPGKRPLSSSVPTILVDIENNSTLAIGGSGGSIITTSTAQVILYYLIFGMPLNKAISQPRLHAQLTPNKVFFETRFDRTIIKELKRYGHVIEIGDVNHGVVQALSSIRSEKSWIHHSFKKEIIHWKNKIYAESDFRKGGKPSGL